MVHENWSWYKLSCWLAGCAVIACSLGLQSRPRPRRRRLLARSKRDDAAARQSNAAAAATATATVAAAVAAVARVHDCRLFRWLVAVSAFQNG